MKNPRFNPILIKLPFYVPGKSIEEVKQEFGLDEAVKMASNESPIGSSPKAIAAAQAMLTQAHLYPGNIERDLRRKLAHHLGNNLNEDHFVIGNGGTDILQMIAQAFIFDGGNAVMSRTTFPMYHIFTRAFGGEPRQVEPLSNCQHDLDGMLEQIDEDTRLVFLCTPNNPTGHIITQAEADAFMARVPEHVVVLFDEAYYDFVDDPAYANSVAYIKEGHNVLILRSFSKTAGLANMRVGFLIGPERLTDYVRHVKRPFHTGAVSLAAAMGSLDDCEYLHQHQQVVWEGRRYLYTKLDELGLNYFPGQTNFVTITNPPIPANDLVQALLQRGVIVRSMAGFGLSNAFRVTVGSQKANEMFVNALKEILDN